MSQLQTITLKHTNPSMGPHERIITIRLSVTAAHQARVEQFLEEAVVNQTVSLQAYLKAVQEKNEKILSQVQENSPQERLASGRGISHLILTFDNQARVELRDVYGHYHLTHFYPDFTSYMVEHGSRFEGGNDFLTFKDVL